VPTLQAARVAQGQDKAAVHVRTWGDVNTLIDALDAAGVVLVWDPAKVPDRRTLFWLLDRVRARLHELPYPPA
jgi:hypothetical protein